MTVDAHWLNKHAVAQAFSRAAEQYDQVASLQRQVFDELIVPALPVLGRHVVDIGCGTGALTQRLAHRYPQATVLGLDLAPGMLGFAQLHHAAPTLRWVCADAEQLPLRSGSVDLVISNFALQWCENYAALFADLRRVMVPGGRLLFTLPGQGTLTELATSWEVADPGHRHVNRFPDAAHLQTVAQATGWQVRALTTQPYRSGYARVQDLLAELKTLGAHNVNRDRSHHLTGKQRLRDLLSAYETYRQPDGLLPASWQVIAGDWQA